MAQQEKLKVLITTDLYTTNTNGVVTSVQNLFDELVVSGYVHKVKPSPDIFQHVIETYQLDPARTLFIDDSFMNIEACLFAGWQGICFNVPGKLDALLAE